MRTNRPLWIFVCAACGGGGGGGRPDGAVVVTPDGGALLPSAPPQTVTKAASGGFRSPTDAVAGPDGKTLYFAAFSDDEAGDPEILKVAATGGATSVLARGAPLVFPTGLVLSCDGATMTIADMGSGGLYSLPVAGGTPEAMGVSGDLAVASGLALADDCSTLYVSGRGGGGQGAVYTVAGGAASVLYEGDPLTSPTGIYVDADNVAWVMDHVGGTGGSGVLFKITPDGTLSTVVDGLRLGSPAGVSLTAGGGTAVIATRNEEGEGTLTAVSLDDGSLEEIDAYDIIDPAGLRTARRAGVFAVADSEGNAVFMAQ